MIKVYTYSHNRPDFIAHQYASMKKYIKDDFEFIVFNNERQGGDPGSGYSPERVQEIFRVCEELGVQCIRVELDPELQFINGHIQFQGDSFVNGGSHACAYSFTWGWKHYISKNDCISVIIDSDMFFIKDISFSEMMSGYNFSYIPCYRHVRNYVNEDDRGEFAFSYPWNGFVIADIPNMPNPQELSWGLGVFNGYSADVGSECMSYISKYKDQLEIKYLDQMSIQRDYPTPGDPHSVPEDGKTIEVGINGSWPIHVKYDPIKNYIPLFNEFSIKIINVQESDKRTYPHQKERTNYWKYVRNCFQYMMEFASKHKFPKPTFIDFIKVETDDDIKNAFVFHYKNASNSHSWMGDQYNIDKTKALYSVLNEYVYSENN